MRLSDTHTHHTRHNALVDIDPVELRLRHTVRPDSDSNAGNSAALRRGYTYSVGIHPWNCLRATRKDLLMLRALAAEPCVKAIGETGLDTLHKFPELAEGNAAPDSKDVLNDSLEVQIQLLKYHVALSEELGKPLILHIVKQFGEIIRLKRVLRPAQPWIIHGFRGKPELARELLRHGFYLSYGEKFNPASVAVTPQSRLLVETDESQLPLSVIAGRLYEARISLKPGELGALDGGMGENA